MKRWGVYVAASAAAVGMTLLLGPAQALSASSATAGNPTWSASVVKSGSSNFKSPSTGVDTYTAYVYLVRTPSGKSPVCSATAGCLTTGTQVVLKSSTQVFLSVPKATTKTLATVSANCTSQTSTSRSYWTYVRVLGTGTTTAKVALSSALSGKYC